ncbi:MAG: hypothetical protein AABX03_00770 [Nanoarchaeota archaeon]
MIRVTVLPNPREGISHDEILTHAFSVLKPEYRTPEALREYATNKLREEIGSGYTEEKMGEIQLDTYPRINGKLFDMVYENKEFPKGSLIRIASLFGVVAEDLLPYDESEGRDERFVIAYKSITGEECSVEEIRGPPKFAGGIVIESLLGLL